MEYQEFTKLENALETGKVPGVILWQGESAIDGAPIVLAANKFDGGSGNDKTGAMLQTWVLPDPRAHVIECNGSRAAKIMPWLKKTGARAICGDCPHAWQYDESAGEYKKGACYVREYQAPAAVLGGAEGHRAALEPGGDGMSLQPDYHSDDFATARLDAMVTLRDAAREARAALYSALNRLEMNDLEGEEGPFIDDCLVAIAMLEEALK